MPSSSARPDFCWVRFSPPPPVATTTLDHFRIDPRLGDDADFDALIEGARRRGLRVILDGVFNHVGREFPAFRQAIA
jgi:glycosidase